MSVPQWVLEGIRQNASLEDAMKMTVFGHPISELEKDDLMQLFCWQANVTRELAEEYIRELGVLAEAHNVAGD